MKKPSPSSYAPDDAKITPDILDFLASQQGTRLRDEVAALLRDSPEPAVSQITLLRKSFPADAVHAALTIGRLQPKAKLKFPHLDYVWTTPEALEQATALPVARHKATRFAAAGIREIIDLCCGIGGDAMALADIAHTTAIDLSPTRLKCLNLNSPAIDTRLADVRDLPLPPAFHIDPARRSGGRRSPAYEDLIPAPGFLLQANLPGAIKLSPAVDLDTLPPGHLEIISHNRTVVQAVLWTGDLANFSPHPRTATLIFGEKIFTYGAKSPIALMVDYRPPNPRARWRSAPLASSPYLYEADGALTRSKLIFPLANELQLTPITPDGGYLLSPTLLNHPAFTPFHALESLPYSERRITQHLKSLPTSTDPKPIEVKTRGALKQVDTDRLQNIFTTANPTGHTVFIFSSEKDVMAIIAARIPQ